MRNNPTVLEMYTKLLSGKQADAMFDVGFGERLATAMPVVIHGKPVYFVTVGIPTSIIYSQIDSILSGQSAYYLLHLIGLLIGIALLIIFLMRLNNRLRAEVANRTFQIERSNKQLADANEKLKTHDHMQQEFINIAAHELRTPVQPILGMAEMLGVYPIKPENAGDQKEVLVKVDDLHMIGRNAARLGRLSSDILDVSRIESGSFNLSKETFDFNELIKEAVDDAKRHVEIDNLEIIINSPKQPVQVIADKHRIMQVIGNLLNNAIRFTRPIGTISVTIESHEDDVRVVVTDCGTGILEDVMPRLFTKFSSSTIAGSGTGLGLYISKAIMEAHGGRICGKNNPNGKGATFEFVIHVAPRQELVDVVENHVK